MQDIHFRYEILQDNYPNPNDFIDTRISNKYG